MGDHSISQAVINDFIVDKYSIVWNFFGLLYHFYWSLAVPLDGTVQ